MRFLKEMHKYTKIMHKIVIHFWVLRKKWKR